MLGMLLQFGIHDGADGNQEVGDGNQDGIAGRWDDMECAVGMEGNEKEGMDGKDGMEGNLCMRFSLIGSNVCVMPSLKDWK